MNSATYVIIKTRCIASTTDFKTLNILKTVMLCTKPDFFVRDLYYPPIRSTLFWSNYMYVLFINPLLIFTNSNFY